jgi:hypothetical protein
MTNAEAIETLKAMRNNLDPRFACWTSEQRKSESLRMAIVLLEESESGVCEQALERDGVGLSAT